MDIETIYQRQVKPDNGSENSISIYYIIYIYYILYYIYIIYYVFYYYVSTSLFNKNIDIFLQIYEENMEQSRSSMQVHSQVCDIAWKVETVT